MDLGNTNEAIKLQYMEPKNVLQKICFYLSELGQNFRRHT